MRIKHYGWSLLYLAVIPNSAWTAQSQISFSPAGKGVQVAQFDWHSQNHNSAPTVHFLIAKIDPKMASVRVVDTRRVRSKQASKEQVSYTLRDVARLESPLVAINGGFTGSLVRPIPTGLVISRKIVLSPLNVDSKTQTGVVCVGERGVVSIVRVRELSIDKCNEALQSGPIVVEAGSVNGINKNQMGIQAARSLIGVDSTGSVYFVSASRASLYLLGEAFTGNDPMGITVDTMINLDGDADSGMIIGGNGIDYGNIDATIPNSLIAGVSP